MENKKENIILEKSFSFSVRIVRLYQFLNTEKKEFVLSRQILKSGTSIGANCEEANGSISKKEFSAKISIALKEARETHYWLRLLHTTRFIDKKMFESLIFDNEEILRILYSISKNSKNNLATASRN